MKSYIGLYLFLLWYKQALQWTPHTRPQKKTATKEYFGKRSGERNVDSRRKMEAAAQDRTGWRQVVCALCAIGSDKA